jgi:AcrR family transcriptional regulator
MASSITGSARARWQESDLAFAARRPVSPPWYRRRMPKPDTPNRTAPNRTVPNRTAPDTTRRSERSRRAIYDAALALIGEVGYPRTTIEGIAARAGVGKQTIYRWWSSKAEVLMEAFLDLAERASRDAGQEPHTFPDSGDLAADLKAVLRATVDELRDPRFEVPTRALAAEGVVDERFGRQLVAQLLQPSLDLYVDRLRAAQAAGDVRPEVDPRIALELFVSPLAQRWLQHTGPISHEYTDTLVDYALHGLAADTRDVPSGTPERGPVGP